MEGPKNNVDEPPELKPEQTSNPQVAALIEAHKKLVDEAPIEKDEDFLEVTAAMLKAIQNKIAAKITPKDSNNQQVAPMAEIGIIFQEVAAKLGELQTTINSSAADIKDKGDIPSPAAKTLQEVAAKLGELQNIIESSATDMGIKGGIPKAAPKASEAQHGTITNIPQVGLQNVDDDSSEAAEPQPKKTAKEGSGKGLDRKGKHNAKNIAKRERRKAKIAQEKSNPPPPMEVPANQTAALAAGRNPNFAAEVRGRPDDLKAKVKADLDRCKSLGDLSKFCVVCDKPAESGCSGCNKAARYCSKECQVLDFPIHTKVCSDFAGPAADDKRPSPQHHRVLFFPAFKVKPEICWAAFRGADTHHGWFELEHEDITEFYKLIGVPTPNKGNNQKYSDFIQVLDGRLIGHIFLAMRLVASEDAPDITDPRVLNQSINALTKPGYLRPWFGPVMIAADTNARYPGLPGPPMIKDVSPRDVHSITRLLERCDGFCVTSPKLYHGETITGLLINNPLAGTNNVMGVDDAFRLADVPLAPLDYSDKPIALAFFLGLRWYIRPCFQSRTGLETMTWNDGRIRYVSYIYDVARIHGGGDGDSGQFNTSPPEYGPSLIHGTFPPSVIILHGSGNPVDPLHLSAFNAFFDGVFKEKKEATRDSFVKFWAKYKQSQGALAANLPSPYKWEANNVIDRIGVYNPTSVGNFVKEAIAEVWNQIVEYQTS